MQHNAGLKSRTHLGGGFHSQTMWHWVHQPVFATAKFVKFQGSYGPLSNRNVPPILNPPPPTKFSAEVVSGGWVARPGGGGGPSDPPPPSPSVVKQIRLPHTSARAA